MPVVRGEQWYSVGGILVRPNRVYTNQAARDAMVWGVDKPTALNTGIFDNGVARTTQTGDQNLSSASNEVFNNVNFKGWISVTGSGTKTFNNCYFYGSQTPKFSTHGLLQGTAAHGNIICNDCTFIPDNPTYGTNGYLGHTAMLRRCRFERNVDLIGGYNTGATTSPINLLVELCFTDNHYWDVNDPNQVDGSHTDGVQLQSGTGAATGALAALIPGGGGTIIRGNYLRGRHDKTVSTPPYTRRADDTSLARSTSMIQITPNVGAITGIEVRKNWFSGSEVQMQATQPANSGNNIGIFDSNRFERNSYFVGHTLDFATGSSATTTNNVYDDDNTAVTVRFV